MRHYSRISMGNVIAYKRTKIRTFVTANMLCLGGMVLASGQSGDSFDDAFRVLKRNDNLQFDLPVPPPIEAPVERETPGWLQAIAEFFTGIFTIIAPILPLIFYGLIAAAVLTVLYFILRDALGVKFQRKKKAEGEDGADEVTPLYKPSTDEARILLNQVDALARDGKYEEAVHTLLYRSIQDIDLKRPNQIRRSLTSREIGNLEILTPDTRSAFSLIGKVVEDSFFGGRKLGLSDFQRCRDAYEQFAVPNAWAA